MKQRKINVAYVEDVQRDLEEYKLLLEKDKTIKLKPMFAPIEFKKEEPQITKLKPDLVLIDYELTRKQPSGSFASYQGGTYATHLMEILPEHPLVLITRRSLLQRYSGLRSQDELGAIDYVVYKDDIDKKPSVISKKLVALATGFAELRNVRKGGRSWQALLKLLKAESLEAEQLQEASPPLKFREARNTSIAEWSVHAATEWILKVLFEYPGILYDSLHASSCLSMAEESFNKDNVQRFLKDTKYMGVFSDFETRWWRNRLQQKAYQLIRKVKMEPILANFVPAFKKLTKIPVKPSICIYSSEEYADSVCYILKQPVKKQYTLEYLPDQRPHVMDSARVSFKAIREDNRVKDELISPAGRELLNEIRR